MGFFCHHKSCLHKLTQLIYSFLPYCPHAILALKFNELNKISFEIKMLTINLIRKIWWHFHLQKQTNKQINQGILSIQFIALMMTGSRALRATWSSRKCSKCVREYFLCWLWDLSTNIGLKIHNSWVVCKLFI